MQKECTIHDVTVWNRGDCCGERLNEFKVTVGNFEDVAAQPKCGYGSNTIKQGEHKTITCDPKTKGRYVGIVLPKKGFLTLCEVRVKGGGCTDLKKPATMKRLLLKNKPTKQSSTDQGGASERAIDGNRESKYAGKSCTHTKRENRAWWQVDLQETCSIDTVTVWNRGDCCGDRLSNFKVKVGKSDVPGKNKACPGIHSADQGKSKTVECGGIQGEFIGIELATKGILTLCEVEARGQCGRHVAGSTAKHRHQRHQRHQSQALGRRRAVPTVPIARRRAPAPPVARRRAPPPPPPPRKTAQPIARRRRI